MPSIDEHSVCIENGEVRCACERGINCDTLNGLKKYVFCRFKDCIWNVELKDPHVVKMHRNYTPIGTQDGFTGICSRPELAITIQSVSNLSQKWEVASCLNLSLKFLKGHVDFTKLMPQGGIVQSQNEVEPFTFPTEKSV